MWIEPMLGLKIGTIHRKGKSIRHQEVFLGLLRV